jgi:predicted nicotinamide N-methyase
LSAIAPALRGGATSDGIAPALRGGATSDGIAPALRGGATSYDALLEAQRPPLVPELTLWLIAPSIDLNARCAELASGDPPFWAFCWGSGQALARHVLDHPELVRGKHVLDFGAGSGVLALAAARAGAARVTAVDWDPRARAITARNAALNALDVEVSHDIPEGYELILASDVLYDEGAARWLFAAVERGCEVLLADPHRHGAMRPTVPPLACVAATAFPDVDYPICSAFLYRLTRSPHP